MRVIVNGCSIQTDLVCVSYEEVVEWAGLTGTPSVIYCSRRDGDVRRQGTMYAGCPSVLLSDVMTFNVAHTGGA